MDNLWVPKGYNKRANNHIPNVKVFASQLPERFCKFGFGLNYISGYAIGCENTSFFIEDLIDSRSKFDYSGEDCSDIKINNFGIILSGYSQIKKMYDDGLREIPVKKYFIEGGLENKNYLKSCSRRLSDKGLVDIPIRIRENKDRFSGICQGYKYFLKKKWVKNTDLIHVCPTPWPVLTQPNTLSVEKLCDNIRRGGLRRPVLINSFGIIMGTGNHRVTAMDYMGGDILCREVGVVGAKITEENLMIKKDLLSLRERFKSA